MSYLSRFVRISWSLWTYLIWWSLVRLHLIHPRLTPAERFARTLEGLGTTFVKLGQGLSLHYDLLPDDYVKALRSLQDHVATFDAEAAIREVEQAFNAPLHEIFAEFDRPPLAAASIAQVHGARLHDGRQAVVKVRRPGIKAQVSQDMLLLKHAVKLLLMLAPGLRQYQPLAMIEEIEVNLRKEMDFRHEARNIKRFVAAFRDSETINIPGVIDELYTEAVLVQERSMGLRVDDPAVKARGPELAKTFVDAYLRQFFVLGLFHGDPHPGNLFIMADGRICFHDFGLVGYLDQATRRNLAALMQAFVHQDSEWLLDAYLDLGLLSGDLDRTEFRRGLEEMLEDYANLALKDWSFAEALMRISRMGRGQNIRVPHHLLVFMRAVFLMEAAVRSLDPEFNLLDGLLGRSDQIVKEAVEERASAAVKRRLKYEAAQALQDIPESLGAWLRRMRTEGFEWRLHHRGLEDLESHLDRGSNRMALAMVILGLYIASSLLMQIGFGPRLAGVPLPALIGYGLALWFTVRLVRGISRSGRL